MVRFAPPFGLSSCPFPVHRVFGRAEMLHNIALRVGQNGRTHRLVIFDVPGASAKMPIEVVQNPCLKLPFRAPDGPPAPFAPPCIRQRARPLTAACRPTRSLAPSSAAGINDQVLASEFLKCLLDCLMLFFFRE